MRGTLVIAIVAAACCVVVGETTVGGFSPVGPEDKDIVSKCENKILETMKEKETSANSGYKITVTMPKKEVQKQVVNGMNYQFKYTLKVKFECASGSTCSPKDAVDKQCTATVHAETDATKPLTYVTGKEPSC